MANTVFTEDWLASIACRETGGIIVKYVNQGMTLVQICPLIEGDYTTNHYHGYSFWQIDIRSFPDFISSGDWVDPTKAAIKAVDVLKGKKQALAHYAIGMSPIEADKAVIASYNCGEGNVIKALKNNLDVDYYTANQNYSTQVFEFRDVYKAL